MRVATYSDPSGMSRASFIGIALLVLTVLLGTSTLAQALGFFAPAAAAIITPAWLGLYLAALVGLMASHGVNWLSWLVRYRILLVILMLGTLASIGWALDARLSLERTVHLLGSTLVAIYIGFTVPLLTTLRALGVVLGLLFVASVGAALALPALGLEDYAGTMVWRGVFNTKNGLGFWAATGVLLFVALSDSVNGFFTRLVCYLMAGLALGLLVFSQSATSLLVMLLAGALSLYLFIAMRFRLGFVRMAVLAVLIGGLAVFAVINVPSAELVGRSDDLTGRGEVWAQTWQLILQRPVTGFGYGVLWFPSADTSWIQETLTDFTWTVHHAHNGFLQVASEIGLPLAVVALLMVVQQLVEILYCQYQRQQAGVLFVLAFSVAYLISNFAEARFLVNRELFWILFIALPISMLRQINLVAAPAAAAPASPGASPAARATHPSSAPGGASAARMALARGGRSRSGTLVSVDADQASSNDDAGDSPWVAAAAAMAAHQAAQREADEQHDGVHDRHHHGLADDSHAGPSQDDEGGGFDDEAFDDKAFDDEAFDQDEMDATLGTLTLADADIDLGLQGLAAPVDDWIDPDATLEEDRDLSQLLASVGLFDHDGQDGSDDSTAPTDDPLRDATEPGAAAEDERDEMVLDPDNEDDDAIDDPLDQLQDLDALDDPEPPAPRN